jgi:hypothetical protein
MSTKGEVGESPCGLELHSDVRICNKVHQLFDVSLSDLQIVRFGAESQRDQRLQNSRMD